MAQMAHFKLSRRQFLQRSALVGAATIGMTALAGCPAAAPEPHQRQQVKESSFGSHPTVKKRRIFGNRYWKSLRERTLASQ